MFLRILANLAPPGELKPRVFMYFAASGPPGGAKTLCFLYIFSHFLVFLSYFLVFSHILHIWTPGGANISGCSRIFLYVLVFLSYFLVFFSYFLVFGCAGLYFGRAGAISGCTGAGFGCTGHMIERSAVPLSSEMREAGIHPKQRRGEKLAYIPSSAEERERERVLAYNPIITEKRDAAATQAITCPCLPRRSGRSPLDYSNHSPRKYLSYSKIGNLLGGHVEQSMKRGSFGSIVTLAFGYLSWDTWAPYSKASALRYIT